MNKKQINLINRIHLLMASGQKDELNTLINYLKENGTNIEEIGELLLNDDTLINNENHLSYNEVLQYFIDFCSYIENDTDNDSIITDELYDRLVEKLINLGEKQPIGTTIVDNDKLRKPHKYPELRGSLSKVHFVNDNGVPDKDTRKSLEKFFRQVKDKVDDIDTSLNELIIYFDMKFDGVSHIIEVNDGIVESILTRGDVGRNLGVDITETMKRIITTNDVLTISELNDRLHLDIPDALINAEFEYGIKVETYMKTNQFDEYIAKNGGKLSNRRSAVTSICNQDPMSIEHQGKLVDYISMQALQISLPETFESQIGELTPYSKFGTDYIGYQNWERIGNIEGRIQLLHFSPSTICISEKYNDNIIDNVLASFNEDKGIESKIKEKADEQNIPIDGVVVTIMNPEVIELLGRSDNKNSFQTAFKFPAGVSKTIINKVDFQVGPITGKLIPMARLKPIVINGNTISNVTLSNKDKLERLNIHEGDEVIIKYDIVPTIFKDDSCKESDNPLIVFPEVCPVCGEPIVDEQCVNTNCNSKIVGHIYNFVERNNIKGIGMNTIIDLVENNFLETIGDLYRLYRYKDELYNLQGYGRVSIDSMLESISKARVLYPHQILGAIGIPNIGFRIMEKVCRHCNVIGNLGYLDDLYPTLVNIKGLGTKTVEAILNGIRDKMKVIEDICANVEIKPYEEETKPNEIICFSGIRDSDFEQYLENNGNKVSNNFTKKTTILIVQKLPMDKPTTKYNKAVEMGIKILDLQTAKSMFGFS